MPGTITKPAGNYSVAVSIPGWAFNGQQFYVVDSNVPDTVARSYRAKVTFAVTLSAPPPGSYPRIFQAWNRAENLNEDATATLARHDLFWHHPPTFGWNWVDQNGVITNNYRSERLSPIGNVIYSIPAARSLNPNIKILAEVVHYALYPYELDENDTWWARSGGQRIPTGEGTFLLNDALPEVITHIANRARAIIQTGQFDGIFLDHGWPQNSQLTPMFQGVRNAIDNGPMPGPLLIVNANTFLLSPTLLQNYVNGVFIESGTPGMDGQTWQNVKNALIYNGAYSRSPKANCLETWYLNSRNDFDRMRATTCLSLIYSNGYALFSDPNSLPAADHMHDWYHPFWSNHSLGLPTSGTYAIGGATARDFQNGTAVWNSNTIGAVTVTFEEKRTSQRTGTRAFSFSLPANDGDIYTR